MRPCRKLFPEWVKKHEEALKAAQQQQAQAQQQQEQQQQDRQQQEDGTRAAPGPAPGAGAAAAAGQQQQLQQNGAAEGAGGPENPVQRYSGLLVGAAAVAAAGVAATLLMKPEGQ